MNINKILFLVIILILVAVSLSPGKSSAADECTSIKCTITGDATDKDIKLTTSNHIYNISGNLTIDTNIPGNKTGVIFVNGELFITQDLKTPPGQSSSGIVFVVKGDVNIDSSVTQIDAVIISEGIIYTAGAGCATNSISEISTGVPIKTLTINGSLISLKQPDPAQVNPLPAIKFCRKLGETGLLKDSTDPAEIINHQVKYLVILRDLLSDTYQKWSEIP